MRLRRQHVEIRSRDYWFKIVDFLQQNWALIDQDLDASECTVFFFGDTSGVFDRLRFSSVEDAEEALHTNGFAQYSLDLLGIFEPVIPVRRPGWGDWDCAA